MSDFKLPPLPKISDFAEQEQTPALKLLLKISHEQREFFQQQLQLQAEQLALQSEQIQKLNDEISILKGEKGKPDIKPSTLNKDKSDNGSKGGGKKKRRGKPKRKKTHKLKIHDEKVIEPEHIPDGAVFKGYEDYVVQDIEINLKNTKYRRARYETVEGESIVGKLPDEVSGSHYGPTVKSFILSQHHEQRVPQNLILKQLWGFGIQISAGQLSQIITECKEQFHAEKEEVLRVGLEVSAYINVDDTGARHKGNNGYCTHIGNKLFAWFSSTESKSRINFLELLRVGNTDYVVNDVAREYMKAQKLPNAQEVLLVPDQVFADQDSWQAHLQVLGITSERHQKIATEGALVASLVVHGISRQLVIMSDDAGQFNIAGFLNALCWVHAERKINKIIPFTEDNRLAQENIRDQIWKFYQELKDYKLGPTDDKTDDLDKKFDEIFKQKTCFQTLNLALERLYQNKTELLLVLKRPEIPLHNNLSENDIRDYVTKRKISATTRSDNGREARDTFLSLKKTCKKLGISFWEYLQDRITGLNQIPPLPELIRAKAQAP